MKNQIKKENKEEYQATHEEVCDEALAHYEKISKEATHWNGLVPKAIEFYKKWGKSPALREENKEEMVCKKCGVKIKDAPLTCYAKIQGEVYCAKCYGEKINEKIKGANL